MSETLPHSLCVLGLDPALRCTGYAVVMCSRGNPTVVDCGVVRTPAARAQSECLRRLTGGMRQLLESFSPDVVAIEGGFFHRNAKTAMVLGAARGILVGLAAEAGKPVYEYAPRRIKQAVCGHGGASKEQIATVVAQYVGLNAADIQADATDAVAVALCHSFAFFTNQGLFLPRPI